MELGIIPIGPFPGTMFGRTLKSNDFLVIQVKADVMTGK